MVEVFKTNIDSRTIAQQIVDEIKAWSLELDASFDLDDCDRILRVCGGFDKDKDVLKDQVMALLYSKGYLATALEEDIESVACLAEALPLENQASIIAFLSIR